MMLAPTDTHIKVEDADGFAEEILKHAEKAILICLESTDGGILFKILRKNIALNDLPIALLNALAIADKMIESEEGMVKH